MSLRRTQHKPQRDTAKAKELADLKQENKHLKRQIGRLRRQIEKLQGIEHQNMQEAEEEHAESPTLAQHDEPNSKMCPVCKHDLIEFKTPTKVLIGCGNCKWRDNGN
ncbi:hypothetical protein EBZ38_08455 [bacterium]|nr:hypothetical protein [bacterium]